MSEDVGDAPALIDIRTRDQQTGVWALHQTIRASHGLADALVEAMRDQPGRQPLVVGGDCSILLGVFPALRTQTGPAGLWFVDGHPDFLDGQGSQKTCPAPKHHEIVPGSRRDALSDTVGHFFVLSMLTLARRFGG